MPERPNFVLVFPDQWRGDCLGYTGHPYVDTPFLDEMAGQGVTFTAAYSACPSCIATRACMARGQTPDATGRIGYQDRVPWRYDETMMTRLRDGGYQTINVGKTHFYPQRANLGFEINLTYDPQDHGEGLQSDYHEWLERQTNGEIRDTTQEINSNSWVAHPWVHEERLHPNTWNMQTALEQIQRRDPMRPFFLQIGFHRPHPPLDPPIENYRRFKDREVGMPPVGDWAEKFAHPATRTDCAQGRLPDHLIRDARTAYFAQIHHLDYQIGRLLQFLGRHGLAHNTYILFIADHGEMLGDHNLWRKTVAYEGSAKVPFVIRPPSGSDALRGATREEPVSHMDIMPTLLDLADLEIPGFVEGSTLAPLIRGENPQWREWMHGEHSSFMGTSQHFVTDGKEKFVWEAIAGEQQFFDLTTDPEETRNLFNDPAYGERVDLWRDRLISVLAQRPEDGFTDGGKLTPGSILPHVRPELDKPIECCDGVTRPLE
jgi:arylsulfatase